MITIHRIDPLNSDRESSALIIGPSRGVFRHLLGAFRGRGDASFELIILVTQNASTASRYVFPINDVIGPAVKLTNPAASTLDPFNEAINQWIIRIAPVSLRLMTNI
jgi:hypothetical protein